MLAKLILYTDIKDLNPTELIGYASIISADTRAYKQSDKHIQQDFMFESSVSLTRNYEYKKGMESLDNIVLINRLKNYLKECEIIANKCTIL